MVDYLESIDVPLDYRTFENRAKKLPFKKLQEMYIANKLTCNYGNILQIDPFNLPDFDFFTYSFPCQDISVAGYQNGLSENSGTRSSLLWEVCKIIEVKKPKYLMMENVKNLIGKKHKDNFLRFLSFLRDLGYENHWDILNASDFGIPQRRERIFCISLLGGQDEEFHFPKGVSLTASIESLLEGSVDEQYTLKKNQTTEFPIQGTSKNS